MSDILTKIADLSPEKRELLELMLQEQGVDISRSMIVPLSREKNTFPLSFAQQRLWFLDQLEPGSPMYNIPSAVRLQGQLDLAALERCVHEIFRRHETLRTTFVSKNGKPLQVIAPEPAPELPVIDLRHLPEEAREAEAQRLAQAEARRPFDLIQGPLLRVTLIRLQDDEYVALLTMHHIVSDGWSMGVLVGEIAQLYEAFSAGEPSQQAGRKQSPLPELRVQYADFAHWQRGWLQGEVLQEQLDYWKQQLGGDPGILELPTDHPRPAFQTTRGASRSFVFSQRLAEGLKALGSEERATLFMTLLAAFQTLLHRYTGQDAINVGSPIANRNRGEIEGLIGFFVNTLVLRADLSGDPTFRELLGRVREMTLGAYAHQDLPFEMLVEELQPERDMSRSPLFQVMFILQNAPMQARRLPDLTIKPIEVHSGTSTFDITLSMGDVERGLVASFEYNTDLFDQDTVERMASHFETLLEGIVADPDRPVSRLPLLPEAERQRLLVEWNDVARDFAGRRDLCVHQLFEAQAARTPQAVAVVIPAVGQAPRQKIAYGELNRRANQLAHYLRGLGVGPNTVVGICVERSLDMIVGALGVLKAGGAYLPVDPMYPQERLAHILSDSQVPVLLTQERVLEQLSGPELPMPDFRILLDADWALIAQESDENPVNRVTPEDLVYMIYTSGSTGQSKGVRIQHRSLTNAYLAWEETYQLDQVHAHLQMANFAFDVFTGDLVRALCSGDKLVISPREWLLDPERLYALMRQEAIDFAEFVPAVLRHLMQYLDENGKRLDFLRVLTCGSDSWYVGEYKRFLHFCGPQTRLINSFGLTEATIDSTFFEGEALELSTDQVIPIGRPFANTRLYILDSKGQPTPIGVPGELHVGGLGVAQGYHNRPQLTAEKFIPDPFGFALRSIPVEQDGSFLSYQLPEETDGRGGGRLYKTGDLARYMPDGNVEFLGRLDYQIKIRGYRIEPGEIEAALERHADVREVAVVDLEIAPEGGAVSQRDKRLVAYVVAVQEPAPSSGDLRRFLQQKVPDYMVPSAFVTLEALPLTPNGKVDRQALPAPDWSQRQLEGEYVPPRTPVEEVLAGVWTQVLGVEQVGVHDNFFALGGHSLLATQLVSRVREAFEIELPLRTVFESPTVAKLGEHVEIAQRTEEGTQAPPIKRIPRDGDLPLSFAQQRLWFLDQLEPDSPLYNMPDAMRITGELDVAALERSLNEIVRRHEVLRTTFHTVDGKPSQRIGPEVVVPVTHVDLSDLPKAQRETEVERLMMADAQRPFNLTQGPLIRATLVRLRPQEHVAILTMHHIVSDGWSSGVLTVEMAALYDAFVNGRSSPLPELEIQYADFAHWQRQWLQGEVLERQLDYWKEQLAGAPPLLELPTDRPRPAVQTTRGAHHPFQFPVELSQALKELSQRQGATLFMTLLAALQTLLARYSGQADVSVGTPIAGRNRAEIEGLIGFFVNTLVMRADLSGAPGFLELLEQVRETALGAYAHQDLPFEMLVDELQPQRNLSYTPLFQVMFFLQNAPLEAQSIPGLTFESLEPDSGTAKFDLSLTMVEAEEGLFGSLRYNADLFDATTIERMMDHFQMLLEGIVADPTQSVTSLPLLTPAERERLLVEWNDTAAPYPRGRCVHQLFEAQVERTPDALAVTLTTNEPPNRRTNQLTYQQLNRQANQLAHYLQERGVGPETLVGICVERAVEMVVGLLGILKAGGAYLPIDPTYPQERISFMLEDARVPVLLTQAHLVDRLPTYQANQPTNKQTNLPTIIPLDAAWDAIAQERDDNPTSGVIPDNPAYIIYTSGSTGRPKGVLIEHESLVNYVWWAQETLLGDEVQRIPATTNLTFDASLKQLFVPLLRGTEVWLVADDLISQPLQLLEEMAERRDVGFNSVPSLWRAMLEAIQSGQVRMSEGSLTRLFVGGEAIDRELVQQTYAALPHVRMWNLYGPTEGTANASVAPLTPDGEVTIGRPIANTRLYILDEQGEPVPVGVPGELHIGGVGVARGYLNRPELTAERFVADPFSDEPQARLYRTGDLVRYRPDGNIQFLGRVDHQVKVRGFRIELGEIETVLGSHPALDEVVVLAREDTPNVKRLVAYVVPTDGAPPTVDELSDFVGQQLPDYMVPSVFVTLETLPLLPNGKLDRRALPAPDQARPDLGADYVAPRAEKEVLLADIWSQVLGVEQVGVHDNFFELGGDSILSIQVISRAGQAGVQLTPKQLFQYPTVAELAAVAGTGPSIQAEQGVIEGPLPLTPVQRWFFERDLPERHHYNQALLLEVHQPLQRELLEGAVERLLEHHDTLRLRFEQVGAPGNSHPSMWKQVNAGLEDDVPFEWIDLSERSPAEQGPAIETRAGALQASLDLTEGPLLRVAYFHLGVGRPGRLLMVIHHLAIDGVSWRILLEDLQLAYGQLVQGKAAQLPPKTTSFRGWARRLVEYAQSETLRKELPHWLGLAGRWNPRLPVDYPGGFNTEASARSVTVSLNEKETRALLQEAPAAYRTEINDLLLAALIRALARWTGYSTLLVELEGHGREDILDGVDLSRTVGWFTTIYPVLLDLEGSDGPGEAITTVKELLRQIPRRGIGYGLLRYLCEDDEVVEQLRALPQAQVGFNYLGQFDQALPQDSPFRPARESRGPDRSPTGVRAHLLEINGGVAGGRLGMEWTYSENLYHPATIERVAQDFIQELRALIDHCLAPEAGGVTPTDFELADLDQKKLDKLLAKLK